MGKWVEIKKQFEIKSAYNLMYLSFEFYFKFNNSHFSSVFLWSLKGLYWSSDPKGDKANRCIYPVEGKVLTSNAAKDTEKLIIVTLPNYHSCGSSEQMKWRSSRRREREREESGSQGGGEEERDGHGMDERYQRAKDDKVQKRQKKVGTEGD